MERCSRAWIVIVIILSFGITVVAGKNGLLSARCVARCLTEHRDSLRGGTDGRSRDLFHRCQNVSRCSVCVKPCSVPEEEISSGMCEKYCAVNERECKRSCRFLSSANIRKIGTCPSPESAVKFEAVCLVSCGKDGECSDNRKCCPNTCGMSCRQPLYRNNQMPPVPSNISFVERREGRALKLSWNLPSNGYSDRKTVVCVVQHRNTTNVRAMWDRSKWTTVTQTQQTSILLRGIHAGHWYQFRVATVSQAGSQGFAKHSDDYKSSRNITKPQAPQNLTEGATTFKNGHVDVEVHWKPPKYSDLPVWRYTIIWSKRLSSISPVLVRIDVLEKTVPGHELSVRLRNLLPGTTYKVEIEATVQQGNKRMRSKKAAMMLTTYSPPKANREDNPFESKYSIYEEVIKIQKLDASKPYFHQGFLKASLSWRIPKAFRGIVKSYMIFWIPESCDQDYASFEELSATTHAMTFEVYDLQFECQYIVRVNAVTSSGVRGKQSTVRFRTPLCRNIRVRGASLSPDCPERVPQPPKSPHAVVPHTETVNCTLNLHLNWKVPTSDLTIDSYVIEYGIAKIFKDADRSLIDPVYSQDPVQIIVANTSTTYILRNLMGARHYIIKLSALSDAGLGQPAFVEIWTPEIVPCGSGKDPEPPDKQQPRGTTRASNLTSPFIFFSTTEGSTTTTSTVAPSVSNVSIIIVTTEVSVYSPPHGSKKNPTKGNIYKAIVYLFFIIGRMISYMFK